MQVTYFLYLKQTISFKWDIKKKNATEELKHVKHTMKCMQWIKKKK